MTQVYVNGPAEIHCGTGAAGALEFLGYTEGGVRINFDAAFEDVITDLSGPRVPFDVQQMGTQAFISGEVNLYNEDKYRKILNRVNYTPGTFPNTVEGAINAGDIGYLMRSEEATGASGCFRLLVYAPYNTKPFFNTTLSSSPMTPAYNFLAAYLADSAEMEVGTRYKRIRSTWRAFPNWTGNQGAGTLYNHDSTGRVAPS